MTQDGLLEFMHAFYQKNLEISKKKNADYSGNSSEPFANFASVEIYSIPAEYGFLTRMSDKMMRIASFVKRGVLLVEDEKIEDTLGDLANYCALFAAYLEYRKRDRVCSSGVDEGDNNSHRACSSDNLSELNVVSLSDFFTGNFQVGKVIPYRVERNGHSHSILCSIVGVDGERRQMTLFPFNPTFEPIEVSFDDRNILPPEPSNIHNAIM